MARLERLRVYPIKGLSGIDVETARILEGGTLAHDREFALFDSDSEVINGKRTARVHDLSIDFDPETATLIGEDAASEEVTAGDDAGGRFDLDREQGRDRAERWFGSVFDLEVTLNRDRSLGFVDRREMGPSVVSTATLETLASWFEGMTVESARRRLRANVEVSGVPAFFEDRFVGEDAPALDIGGVRIEGVTPCGRCVVPQRDPDTGEPTPEFRERFLRKREETFPSWADVEAFDHFYTLMIIGDVLDSDRGETLSVGDPAEIGDPVEGRE